MQLKFNLLSPYLLLTSSDLSFSFFWWKGVTVTWHNSLPGVTNVLVDRIVSLPAHHCSGHRPSPKRWKSTTSWQTSNWALMASARQEQRPGPGKGGPLVLRWSRLGSHKRCWAGVGPLDPSKSLCSKWRRTSWSNGSTWQRYLDLLGLISLCVAINDINGTSSTFSWPSLGFSLSFRVVWHMCSIKLRKW